MLSLLHTDILEIIEGQSFEKTDTISIYALADAALDKWFLKRPEHLKFKNLLAEAAGDKAAEISPHLIQLGSEYHAEWQYISKEVVGTPKLTIIVSKLNFDELYAHLRQFLSVKFEGGLEMYLAFWDPAILGTLLGQSTDQTLYVKQQVFSDEQKTVLLKPILSWWYWDRLENLQQIMGENQSELMRLYDWRNPFVFTAEQEEQMVEATFPDHLIYYLKLNNPFLVENFKEWELYQYVIEKITLARDCSLEGTRDILNFICLTMIYKDNFDHDAGLQNVLSRVKDRTITMDLAMEELEEFAEES